MAAEDAPPTAREELLSNRGWLALARIERAWRAPDGERWVQLRWYEKPEATHMGRQVGLGHDSVCALLQEGHLGEGPDIASVLGLRMCLIVAWRLKRAARACCSWACSVNLLAVAVLIVWCSLLHSQRLM